ncbi:MAG: B12-binding domain-containing radical SAM protein [Ignavibacteriales bacterium]
MMKIVLTHGYFLEEDVKEKNIMRPYPPLGILSLSAYLENKGMNNEVIDTTFSSFTILLNRLNELRPKYIGIYVNLITKLNVLKIIRWIKEDQELKDSTIILGGPDVRYNARDYLRRGADYLVLGEGEETIYELITTIELKGCPKTEEISGIAFLNETGELVLSPDRAQISNMDELPFPDRSKIDMHKYLSVWKLHHGINAVSVSTMRGCPYTCKWCSRAVYGMSYRRRSPANVADELEVIIRNYDPDTIWFVDDVFTISHKWLEGFTSELERRKLKLSYECITRADRMNESVVSMLKNSGCYKVWIGAESGSQRVIDLMDRRVNVLQVREMIKLVKQYGIEAGTFIMLGYPGETEDDIEETILHLKEALPDYCTFTVAYPIKGTDLFLEVEDNMSGIYSFENNTDRDYDFMRTYNRDYYGYAVQRVYSEYNLHKLRSQNKIYSVESFKLKIKSLLALAGMKIERIRST